MVEPSVNDTMDFLVHCKIQIAARPAEIWPYFAQLDWMNAPKLVSIAGDPGGVGGRFEGYFDEARETIGCYVENVEWTPEVRRTIQIDGLDGVPVGFTSFELIPNGEETIAAYDVYCRTPPPRGLPPHEALSQGRSAGDDVLRQLKALVDGPGSQRGAGNRT